MEPMGVTTSPRRRWRKKHWLFGGLLIVGVVFLIWLGLLIRDGLLLRADVLALQGYADSLPRPLSPASVDLTVVQPYLAGLHDHLVALRSHAGPVLALAPALGWLPNIGGDVQAAPALLDMAVEYLDLAQRAAQAAAPHWPPSTDGQISLPGLTQLLQDLQPEAAAWRELVDRAQAARQNVATDRLSSRLQNLLQRYDQIYPLAQLGLQLLPSAPELLGADRPRTYLVLVQNEDELRATGGFISAAGRITVASGKVVSMTVEDSYAIDDFSTPYPDAPQPVNDYMGIDLLVFRDSNWSPDFSVTARQAISLYTQTRGGQIDGVIGLNQNVVEALIVGVGPVTVDGQTIATAQDFRAYIQRAWNPSEQTTAAEWVKQRKGFIGRLMQRVLDQVMNNSGQVDWLAVGQALQQVQRSRDLLMTFTDPALNEPLHRAQLDGTLRTPPGDYLMVVDTNMGFNKVSAVMQEALYYTLTLPSEGVPDAELTVVYTNPNQSAGPCVQRPPDYDLSTRYEQMLDDCYWLYRRVLVPAGSELSEATRHPTQPGELLEGRVSDGQTRVTEEDGKTVFGTFLIVARGQQFSSSLHYTLPATILQATQRQWVYTLLWQKQPGAQSWPATVTITWPAGLRLQAAQPQPLAVTARSVTFQFSLDTDREVSVTLAQ